MGSLTLSNLTITRGSGQEQSPATRGTTPGVVGETGRLCFRNDVVKSFNAELEIFRINVLLEKLDFTHMHAISSFR